MKIYYYKQQQNTFDLFGKKSSRNMRLYLVGATIGLTIAGVLFWKLHSSSPKKVLVSLNSPVAPAVIPDQNAVTGLDEETVATTLNIQRNIQEDAQLLTENATRVEPLAKQEAPKTLPTVATNGKTQVVVIRKRDTLSKIFSRLSLSKKELNAILNSGKEAGILKHLKPGQKFQLTLNDNHSVQELTYSSDELTTLTINRVNDKSFKLALKTAPLEARQAFAKFTVYGSVASAAKKAGLDKRRTGQLATIFKTSIDFNKGNHTGDKVSVLFQDYFLNGKKVKDGEIVAAEYKTATNTYQAVKFTDPNGHSGYYSPDGSSMEKRFLPAPVKFTRISSLFNPKRWHPVLHRFRHHQGVDYAAPYGTPIKTVANGVIAELGRKGGYGNTIVIKHDSSYSTLYGHLSKYATNLKVGQHVQQGQLIGYVGSSGLATGPHLHFEFRINGVHRNPLTVALPNGKSITHALRNKFHNEVKKLLAKMDAHKNSHSG